MDSLALICENPKTTEPILEVEFDLIKHFLYFNSDNLSENSGKLPANLAGLTRNYGERKLLKTGLWL